LGPRGNLGFCGLRCALHRASDRAAGAGCYYPKPVDRDHDPCFGGRGGVFGSSQQLPAPPVAASGGFVDVRNGHSGWRTLESAVRGFFRSAFESRCWVGGVHSDRFGRRGYRNGAHCQPCSSPQSARARLPRKINEHRHVIGGQRACKPHFRPA